jgi:hypothetical protein
MHRPEDGRAFTTLSAEAVQEHPSPPKTVASAPGLAPA